MFDESLANFLPSPSAVFEFLEEDKLKIDEDFRRRYPVADCDCRMPACGELSEFLLRPSEDETSEVGGGIALSDPLGALLSFGDEDDDRFGPIIADESHCELVPGRKRPCEELEDEDEVESKLCHNIKRQKSGEVDTSHEQGAADASVNGTVSAITQTFFDVEKFGDQFCLDQSADELQMLCDNLLDAPEHQCSSWNPDRVGGESISSGSARQSRRQKIKATVKLLREAIPGGDCMDTAIVLDEAINYVKFLQLQVQALGAQRLAQRSDR